MRIAKFICYIFLFFSVPSISFSKDSPRSFRSGQNRCAYCMMGISDMRFRSEAKTKKGKYFFFDSIECLSQWSKKNKKTLKVSWVGDFFKKNKWVKFKDAFFLHSKHLHSPMGAGLSAYKTKKSLIKAKKMYKGTELNKKQLLTHIKKWKKRFNK
ncbi:MAG: hypothetical protein HAW60_04415 [Bdellovibrionales bacterium]|nr:hypothetical protein [Bdellovibrionales bacterium]